MGNGRARAEITPPPRQRPGTRAVLLTRECSPGSVRHVGPPAAQIGSRPPKSSGMNPILPVSGLATAMMRQPFRFTGGYCRLTLLHSQSKCDLWDLQ